MLLTPSMQIIPGRRQLESRSSASRWSRFSCANRWIVAPRACGQRAPVVDRLVGAAVEEHRAPAGQDGDHRHVDVGDRRQHQAVLAAQERGEPVLDLLVEDRAAQQARPARVGAPPPQVVGDRVDDLLVEVEPEVVARRVVGQPLVADADLAPVDLVDDGVEHPVRVLEPGEVLGRADPALEPAVVLARAPAQRLARIHRRGRRGAVPVRPSEQGGFVAGLPHALARLSDGSAAD